MLGARVATTKWLDTNVPLPRSQQYHGIAKANKIHPTSPKAKKKQGTDLKFAILITILNHFPIQFIDDEARAEDSEGESDCESDAGRP